MTLATIYRHRLWSRTQMTTGCWLWTGCPDNDGYGHLWTGSTTELAHRVVYRLLVGPIPAGLEVDHLCNVPACVRPDHLEPVTTAENNRRKALRRDACPNGHPYTPENTLPRADGFRRCAICRRAANRAAHLRYVARRKAAA